MAERYDIDFVRAILQYELDDATIFMTSFYEQIGDPNALERYGKKAYDLAHDLNKADYKARGIVAQNGEADIVNITSNYICPLEYSVRLDVAYERYDADTDTIIGDVEYVNEKVNLLIAAVKGKKYDLAIGEEGDIYVTKTPVVNDEGQMCLDNSIYMIQGDDNWTIDMDGEGALSDISDYWFAGETPRYVAPYGATESGDYVVYVSQSYNDAPDKLYEVEITYTHSETTPTFAITKVTLLEDTITKYKVSISINNQQRDLPYDLNGAGRLAIFFNGQATIVDENVMLGNDIVQTTIQVGSGTIYSVEPTEIPTATKVNDGDANYYQTSVPKPKTTNTHIATTPSFTFVLDKSNALLLEMYKLSRYQTMGTQIAHINYVWTIAEYDYQFGVLNKYTMKAKIDDISNLPTNGDVMLLKASFKLGDYT